MATTALILPLTVLQQGGADLNVDEHTEGPLQSTVQGHLTDSINNFNLVTSADYYWISDDMAENKNASDIKVNLSSDEAVQPRLCEGWSCPPTHLLAHRWRR